MVTQHVPRQVELLRAEGVDVSDAGEVPSAALWQPSHAELFLRK